MPLSPKLYTWYVQASPHYFEGDLSIEFTGYAVSSQVWLVI